MQVDCRGLDTMNSSVPSFLQPLYETYFYYSIVVGILDFALNAALVAIILIFKLDHQSNRFLFITDLACGAALYGVTLSLSLILQKWGLSHHKTTSILHIGGIQLAALNLTALVIDQYIFIAYPLRYHIIMSRWRAIGITAGIVLTCLLSCSVMGVVWDDSVSVSYFGNLPKWYHVFTLLALFITPLVVIVWMNLKTLQISRRHLQQIRNLPEHHLSDHATSGVSQRHWSGVITTSLICIALTISWTPLGGMMLWHVIDGAFNDVSMGNIPFTVYGLCASEIYVLYGIWIPLIYAIRSPEVRKLLRQLKKMC